MDEIELTELEKRLSAGSMNNGTLFSLRGEFKQARRLLLEKAAKAHHRKKAKRDPKRRPKP